MNPKLVYMRNFGRIVMTARDRIIFAAAADETLIHPTGDPESWSALLQRLAAPATGASLRARGALPEDLSGELFDRLVETGHLLAAQQPETLLADYRRRLSSAPSFYLESDAAACRHLLVGCSGSVVSGLMAQTLLSLSYTGFQEQLDVILTETARRFLTRELLESYGIRCWSDGFEQQDGIRVPHVALARAADIILVIPATGDAINRIAHSSCSDLLSLCIAASDAPVVLVPAMNTTMWNNPGIQRNLRTLRDDRRYIVEPATIFGAADFGRDAQPMYGGHGSLWAGPVSLIQAMRTVLGTSRPLRAATPA